MTQKQMTGEQTTGERMAAEIAEQPAMVARILDEGVPRISEIADHVRAAAPRTVLLAARGTSDHAALWAKYLLEVRLGLPVGLASPSTVSVYGGKPRYDGVLAVAVSQSGASPDLVAWLDAAAAGGATTLAVTNAPDSPLAATAGLHLDLLAGPELAVAATKTFTAELVTLALLVEALADGGAPGKAGTRPEGWAELPGLLERALELEPDVDALAVRYRFAERLVAVGRGLAYPVAREAALKLMETSYLVAHAFSGADLMHGPLAMLEPGYPVLAFAPPGAGADALAPVLARLDELGADLLVVGGPRSGVPRGSARHLTLPDCREEHGVVLSAVVAQLLALHVARTKGLDPDAPRALRKVTETR